MISSKAYPLLALLGLLTGILLLWVGVSPKSTPLQAPTALSDTPVLVAENSHRAHLLDSLDLHIPRGLALAQRVEFNEKRYQTYVLDIRAVDISFHWRDEQGKFLHTFESLEAYLGKQNRELLFAINGGMFSPTFYPLGLYIERGKELVGLNLKDGAGNFYRKPNGVFFIGPDGANIIESTQFIALQDSVAYGIQSGPIMLYNGKIHPYFDAESQNAYIRSGVGLISPYEIVFIVSEEAITLFELAKLFKSQFHCQLALYLDGGHSSMFLPELDAYGHGQKYGPIIAVSKLWEN